MEKSIHTPEHERLCRLLKARRVYLGLLQADVCERLEVNRGFVSKYETGERRLDVIELRQVCEALDTNLIDFLSEFEAGRIPPADAGRGLN